MRRRAFIAVLGGAATAWPFAVRSQQAAPVVGFLNLAEPVAWAARVAAFRRGLNEVGYVEGQNVAIEYRWAEGHHERLSQLADDLVARGVTVIAATGGGVVAMAAKRATTRIPIVFTLGGDPVKQGLVATLNRPGGNVTGVSLLTGELITKRLEILRDLAPATKTIAFLVNPGSDILDEATKSLSTAVRELGLQLSILKASSESDLDLAFANLPKPRPDALILLGDAFFESRRDQLVALAARYSMPSIFDTRNYAEAGGLVSYGPDYTVAYREAGAYVGRILHGAKPVDLPVVQLSKIELVINAKTAAALGLTIPPSLLARADEVIE